MNKFKPMKSRIRATFAAGVVDEPRLGKIDRENGVLHDVQITLEGEAKGHDVWLDRAFCEDVAKAGDAMGEAGVKVRFGHPAMCSDALGTYLGRASNFRVADFTRKDADGNAVACSGVVADVALDANADRREWILNMAESAPDTFGQSIVFTYADHKVVDAEGVAHSYRAEVEEPPEGMAALTAEAWLAQSADGKVYAVLGKLLGTDFTDTPAATDGVFSDKSLAAQAEDMLDEHPEILKAVESNPDAVYQFLSRVGILDRIESKRVKNLQSEKDREIARLCANIEEISKAFEAEKEEFNLQLKDRDGKLAAALAEVEQLSDALKTAREDLALKDKHLSKLSDTLAMLGHRVNKCPNESSGDARAELARLPYAERAEFYKAHKGEIDKR